MTVTREVTWGEGLVVAAFRSPRGLKGAVDAIHGLLGEHIGTRNTFAKLFKADDPGELRVRDVYRAWLLIVALGENPADWGISDEVVPPGYDVARLREELARPKGFEPLTFWSGAVSHTGAHPGYTLPELVPAAGSRHGGKIIPIRTTAFREAVA